MICSFRIPRYDQHKNVWLDAITFGVQRIEIGSWNSGLRSFLSFDILSDTLVFMGSQIHFARHGRFIGRSARERLSSRREQTTALRVTTLMLALGVWWLLQAVPQSQPVEIKVAAGQTADLWLGVNVTGTLHYAVRTKDGTNKMRMWWIMEPLGNVRQLGLLSRNGSLPIPGKLNGSLSAKLRGKADVDTIVYIGENVRVDRSVSFKW